MGLYRPTWGPGVRVSAFPLGDTSYAPLEDHPLAIHCETSALYCWILEILCCNPKGRRALMRVPSTEWRSVGLCWEHSNTKGPEGSKGPQAFSHSPRAICTVLLDPLGPLLQSERTQDFSAGPVYGRAKCLPIVRAFKT